MVGLQMGVDGLAELVLRGVLASAGEVQSVGEVHLRTLAVVAQVAGGQLPQREGASAGGNAEQAGQTNRSVTGLQSAAARAAAAGRCRAAAHDLLDACFGMLFVVGANLVGPALEEKPVRAVVQPGEGHAHVVDGLGTEEPIRVPGLGALPCGFPEGGSEGGDRNAVLRDGPGVGAAVAKEGELAKPPPRVVVAGPPSGQLPRPPVYLPHPHPRAGSGNHRRRLLGPVAFEPPLDGVPQESALGPVEGTPGRVFGLPYSVLWGHALALDEPHSGQDEAEDEVLQIRLRPLDAAARPGVRPRLALREAQTGVLLVRRVRGLHPDQRAAAGHPLRGWPLRHCCPAPASVLHGPSPSATAVPTAHPTRHYGPLRRPW
ncbi:hypothetical protein SFR_1091 [Streptomyces sp. FR-008]|nr:hypothetical protein SFR_1091 [Streptomyces sp. FR-008]